GDFPGFGAHRTEWEKRKPCDARVLAADGPAPPGARPRYEAGGMSDESLGPVMVRLHRHGDDRQPSICLDALRRAHGEGSRGTALAAFRGAVGLWPLYRRRHLGHAVLRLVHRQIWSPVLYDRL